MIKYLILIIGLIIGVSWIELPPTKPNIIVVLMDDAEMIDIAHYGGMIDTPNMDFLAQSGMTFTNAYTHATCSPTRAALMTGMYAPCVGMTDLADDVTQHPAQLGHMNLLRQTIQEFLLSYGYNTFMSGKWHAGTNNHPPQPFELPSPYGPGFQPLDRGFENYVGLLTGLTGFYDSGTNRWRRNDVLINRTNEGAGYANGFYATDWLGDEASNFIDTLSTGNPFYLYFAPNAPHTPYHPPLDGEVQKYMDRYSALDDMTDICDQALARYAELGIAECKTLESTAEPEVLNPNFDPDPIERHAIRSAMIESVDNQIGKIIASLQAKGELDNTLIMIMSDNGGEVYAMSSMFAPCPLTGAKRGVREGGVHTPFIAFWPDEIQAGSITDQLTHVIDVFPTIKDIISGFAHNDVSGISLKNTLLFNQEIDRCITTESLDRTAVLCSDLWKLNIDNNFDPPQRPLFNLKCDRTESVNVDAGAIKDRLEEIYNEYRISCNAIGTDSIATLLACYPNCDI